MAVFLQRDVVLHITPNDGDGTAMSTPVVYKVPVQEGFSFSQTTNSSEVTLSEMESTAGTSRRGRRMFNDSLAPAEWSFTTYIRPFLAATGAAKNHSSAVMHAAEEVLWNALLSRGHPQETGTYLSAKSAQTNSQYLLTTANSNTSALNTLTFEFQFATNQVYKLTKAVVNSANISFDVDGIAQVEWGGFAELIEESATELTSVTCQNSGDTITKSSHGIADGTLVHLTSFSAGITNNSEYYVISSTTNTFQVSETSGGSAVAVTADGTGGVVSFSAAITASTIEQGQRTSDTSNFIRNRLTVLTVDGTSATNHASVQDAYSLTLTGGNVSIDNGITYLTPDTLGSVNTPLEHVTGPRNISGAFTCYLAAGDGTSADFWQDMSGSGQRNVVTNIFDLSFKIGGTASPYCLINLPTCHIEIPSHAIDEVISLETNFHAIPSDLDTADEMTIKLVGPTAATA